MITLYQRRDFGEKINATINYVTQNFRSLGIAVLYIGGPAALLAGIASGLMQSSLLNLTRQTANGNSSSTGVLAGFGAIFSGSFLFVLLFGVLAQALIALTVYTHLKLYNQRTGGGLGQNSPAISVAEIWAEVQPNLGRVIITSLLVGLVTFAATLFLIIPGIYVGVVLSLAIAVTVFEGTDFSRTWSRCFQLIAEKWWSQLGLLVVMGILVGVVSLVFTAPAAVLGGLMGAKLLPDLSTSVVGVAQAVATVGQYLLYSILFVAVGFQYFNLVEKTEGTGLLSQIDSIGSAPSPVSPPQTRPDEGDY
jgi:hypothetical protein